MILKYLREVVDEHGLAGKIRFHHTVTGASWDSQTARWSVEVGRERFESSGGSVIHPQHWPEDLDYTAKKVVVIGSGATAVTLVPAMAGTAGHVTMLQRSPTYVLPVPAEDPVATVAHKMLPEQRANQAMRRKNIAQQRLTWRLPSPSATPTAPGPSRSACSPSTSACSSTWTSTAATSAD